MLTELAEATHMQAGTLARSMLLMALDGTAQADAASAPRNVVDFLESIPGALELERFPRSGRPIEASEWRCTRVLRTVVDRRRLHLRQ